MREKHFPEGAQPSHTTLWEISYFQTTQIKITVNFKKTDSLYFSLSLVEEKLAPLTFFALLCPTLAQLCLRSCISPEILGENVLKPAGGGGGV